jgi:hypothetical protein
MILPSGIVLVWLGALLYFLHSTARKNCRYTIDFMSIFSAGTLSVAILHHEIAFRNINNLASHKVASYNQFHWLSLFANLRMSPPPSSFGGLNPNRSFGFFFAAVRAFQPSSTAGAEGGPA